MSNETEIAIAQIDAALAAYKAALAESEYSDLGDLPSAMVTMVVTRCMATVDRIAPPSSRYRKAIADETISSAVGALQALRQDYEAGYIASLPELIHAELFSDFLEMADHLLDGGFKDASVVIAGSTLEGHLRQLAEKVEISAMNADGRPLTADRLNGDLAKAEAYGKTDQKAITAWLGLRNDAAHGNYEKYGSGQVGPMIAGIRDFIRRIPA